MPCGVVLREILKNESVAAIVLYDQSREGETAVHVDQVNLEEKQTGEGVFWKFFPWIDGGAFEVSTDAFTTFRVMNVCSQGVVQLSLMQHTGDSHTSPTAGGSVSLHQF